MSILMIPFKGFMSLIFKMAEIDKHIDSESVEGDSYHERINKYFADRRLTQENFDLLNSKNDLKITKQELCTEDIFYWLIKCEALFSYEIVEYFNQQNIQINQLPWTPEHLRLHNYVYIHNKIGKTIFRMYIGGNTAAPDWAWYETKDFYFPDFDIYNDVTIHYFDGTYELWNYPEEQFPPVYAHSTVYDEQTNKVYITGGLGFGDRQRKGITEIYQLDLESKDIQQVETFGETPPCLHSHDTKMWNHDSIEMKGGNILKNGIAIKNLYVWSFNLKTKTWLQQESEKYQHWLITPKDDSNFLFSDYRILIEYEKENSDQLEGYLQNLVNNNLHVADYKMYTKLYLSTDDMYLSKTDNWSDFIYTCIVDGQVYSCFEGYNRIEVAFQSSASIEFQNFIINDLKSKLKLISGNDAIIEKIE